MEQKKQEIKPKSKDKIDQLAKNLKANLTRRKQQDRKRQENIQQQGDEK